MTMTAAATLAARRRLVAPAVAAGARLTRPASQSRAAAARRERKPHEIIAVETKLPIRVGPMTSGVKAFSLIGAVGFSVWPNS